MKQLVLGISLLLLIFPLAMAEEGSLLFNEAEPLNPTLQGLAETIQPFFRQLSLLVGGIFGVYIILLIVRIYYEHKLLKVLQDIRYDVDQLNKHYRIPYSKIRKSLLGKILRFSFNTVFTPMRDKKK